MTTSAAILDSAPAEVRLMLACARVQLDAARKKVVADLARGRIDWPLFLSRAVWHRITPIVHHSLETACPDAPPADVRQQLADRIRNSVARNDVLVSELADLLAAFEAQGIPAVPLKGPVVATMAYGDRRLRWAGDLDIVVRMPDFARAAGVLLSRGYRPDAKSAAFVRRDGKVTVDLQHREGAFPCPLDLPLPWDRLVRAEVAGGLMWSLGLEDMFIHLCAHGAKHCWDRLGWLCDVSELCRAQARIDWDVVADRSRELRLERVVQLAVILIRDLLDGDFPTDVVARMAPDPVARALARYVEGQVFFGSTTVRSLVLRPWFRIRTGETLADKAAYAGYYANVWVRKPATTFRLWRGETRRRVGP